MLRLGKSDNGATFARDEYGRFYKGVKGNPLGAVLAAAGVALPFVPGIGPAASAALAGLIALGQGKSLKDAALAAARAPSRAERWRKRALMPPSRLPAENPLTGR